MADFKGGKHANSTMKATYSPYQNSEIFIKYNEPRNELISTKEQTEDVDCHQICLTCFDRVVKEWKRTT